MIQSKECRKEEHGHRPRRVTARCRSMAGCQGHRSNYIVLRARVGIFVDGIQAPRGIRRDPNQYSCRSRQPFVPPGYVSAGDLNHLHLPQLPTVGLLTRHLILSGLHRSMIHPPALSPVTTDLVSVDDRRVPRVLITVHPTTSATTVLEFDTGKMKHQSPSTRLSPRA